MQPALNPAYLDATLKSEAALREAGHDLLAVLLQLDWNAQPEEWRKAANQAGRAFMVASRTNFPVSFMAHPDSVRD